MKKSQSKLISLFAILLTFSSVFYPTVLAAKVEGAAVHNGYATGLKAPTSEEKQWFDQVKVSSDKVKLNQIGIDRVNNVLAAKGNKVLDPNLAVPVGSEPVAQGGVAVEVTALPDAVDNSTTKYFPSIRSQGSIGSCASFATTYYLMTHMTALARDRDVKNGTDATQFSPKWSYNLVNGGADDGSSIEGNIQLMMNHGAASWAQVPYTNTGSALDYLAWCPDPEVWRDALSTRLNSTGSVGSLHTQIGLDNLKQYLNNGYVLVFATYINSWQFTTIKDDPSTSADDAYAGKMISYLMNGSNGGHAMTIVGYNDNIWTDINNNGLVDNGEKGALKIANSWGTGWYEGGYTWIAYDALKAVSAVAGAPIVNRNPAFWNNAATWVTAKTAYQPKLTAEFTVNTAARSQMVMSLGYAQATAALPEKTYTPYALSSDGGAFAFDGTKIAGDASFVLDYTDLITQYSLDPTLNWKWFLTTMDSANDNNALTLKSFKLVDESTGDPIVCTEAFPATVNASTVTRSVIYNLNHLPPTAPVANSSIPSAGTTGVDPTKTIKVLFDQSVLAGSSYADIAVINDTTQTPVIITKTISGTTLEIKPATSLAEDNSYTVTIPAGAVTNVYSLPLEAAYSFSFTTGKETTPPTVLSSDPIGSATNVPVGKTITVNFSEPIVAGPESAYKSIKLELSAKGKKTVVTATVGVSGSSLTIDPAANLRVSSNYIVTIPAGAVCDAKGNALTSAYTISFKTAKR